MLNIITAENRAKLGKNLSKYLPVFSGDVNPIINKINNQYKVYTGLLTQSSGNAPEVTVLENTLGGDVIWAYNLDGNFSANLTGGFKVGKTVIIPIMFGDDWASIFLSSAICVSNDQIDLFVWYADLSERPTKIGDPTSPLFKCPIEIRVYN